MGHWQRGGTKGKHLVLETVIIYHEILHNTNSLFFTGVLFRKTHYEITVIGNEERNLFMGSGNLLMKILRLQQCED